MPKLWNATVSEHRREVRDAILDATAAQVAERGPASITMSQIAEDAGIGRATLYKYFPDIQAILVAWHDRLIRGHLDHLATIRDRAPREDRLQTVLETYALLLHGQRDHHGTELAAILHRGEHVARAHHKLRELVRNVLIEAAEAGAVRRDAAPDELTAYCIHALAAARSLPSRSAVLRLVKITLRGLSPSRENAGANSVATRRR